MRLIVPYAPRRRTPIVGGGDSSGGGAGTDWPNQPAGWTTFDDTNYSTAVTHTSTPWGLDDAGDQAKVTKQTDQSDAPLSPPDAFRGEYISGGGTAPFSIRREFASGEQYKNFYYGVKMKMSPAFTSPTDITGSKFLWFPTNGTGADFQATNYCKWYGLPVAQGGTGLQFVFDQQGAVDRSMFSNLASAVVDALLGSYFTLEIKMGVNASEGTANGTLDVWINGTKTHGYTDVNYSSVGAARTVKNARLEPTYGAPGQSPPANMFVYFDHSIMAGSA